MNNYAKTFAVFTASILLASCSSKFNSREEASIAVGKYLRGGREVVLVYVPSDKEVEEQIIRVTEEVKAMCDEARDEVVNQVLRRNDIAYIYAKTHADAACSVDPTLGLNKEMLTTRSKQNTRICDSEPETSQFVCKERRFRGDEISRDRWDDLSPDYTYFRY